MGWRAKSLKYLLVAALALFMVVCGAFSAHAATFTVTAFTDTASGGAAGNGAGAPGDLRSAILAANSLGGTGNTINFDCGNPPCTIVLNGPLPPITSNLTIDGGQFGNVILDGNHAYRVFFVDSGHVTLANLQIQNALAEGGAGGSGYEGGGGGLGAGAGLFVNQATAVVAIQNTYFLNCVAEGGAGGEGLSESTAGGGGGGGGGMTFAGGSGAPYTGGNNGAGGGGGGIQAAGADANTDNGGTGGAGGGGGGGNGGGTSGAGGSGYAGNPAGGDGDTLGDGGLGGFGGGGGGGADGGQGANGGFGGGGGAAGSDCSGAGNGGAGGGGAGGNCYGAAVGGILSSGISGGNGGLNSLESTVDGVGGGGGAAAGPAIFVAYGTVSILNSTSSGSSATGGTGGLGAASESGDAGSADSTPVFNYGGSVDGSTATGPINGALASGLPATHFSVTISANPVAAGASSTVTVQALDENNNTATGYNGTVTLSSNSGSAVLPTLPAFSSGSAQASGLDLKQSGNDYTVTATDTTWSYITGTSTDITVDPGPVSVLAVSAPSGAGAGVPFSFSVTAQDADGNTVTSSHDAVTFSSSDSAASLPAGATLSDGVGSFQATLNTPGNQTITADDTTAAANGTSGTILVSSATPPQIVAAFSPASVTAGGTGTTTLTVTLSNPNAIALSDISASNTYPAGIAYDSVGSETCGGSSVFGGSGWSVSGITLAAHASCVIPVSLHATAVETAVDTTGPVSALQTGTGGSATATLDVTKATASVQLIPTATTMAYGNDEQITVTVNGASGLATPTGTVTLIVDGSGHTLTLNEGSAIYDAGALAAGSYTVTGSYSGDGTYGTETLGSSATPLFTISKATPSLTWTAPASITYGTALSATQLDASANVSGTFDYTPAAGMVLSAGTHALSAQFTPADTSDYATPSAVMTNITVNPAALMVTAANATRVYGAVNPSLTGTVTGAVNGDVFTVSGSTAATVASTVGSYAILPTVTGQNLSNYTVTATNGTLTVTQAATTTALSASASSLTPGQSLTLTALVQDASNGSTGTPTGTVNFYDGTTLLGSGILANGTATFTTSTLASGATQMLSAIYEGDTNFAGSTSSSPVSVSVTASGFSLNVSGTQSQTVVPGGTATYNFQISPAYGSYPSQVSFAASGLPAGATATFSPATIAANGGTQNVTLTIQTPQPGTSARNSPMPREPFERGAPLALGFLLLPMLGMRRIRKRWLGRSAIILLLVIAGMAGAVSLTGCGTANGFNGQAVNNYSITVTATSGGVQHSFAVNLNVQ